MDLSYRQWFVRWYLWSQSVWDEFLDRNRRMFVEVQGTNLCEFIRVTFFWAPLVIVGHLVLYATMIAAVTVIPVALFGPIGYVSILVGIAIVVGAIWAIKAQRRLNAFNERTGGAAGEAHAPQPEGFVGTVRTYLVSTKQRVCPIITFHETERRVS